MESLKRIAVVFGLLCLIGIPAFVPELFIGISIIAWPIAYVVIWIMSIGADPSNTVPWVVYDTSGHWFAMLIFFGMLGLVNGGRGVLAMLLTWGPAVMLPGYLIAMGVAAENDRGWTGYMYDNYQDSACELRPNGLYDGPCVHVPVPGLNLPIFATAPDNTVIWTKPN